MLWVQIPRSSKEFFNKALESGVFLFIKLPLLQTDTTKYDITLAIEKALFLILIEVYPYFCYSMKLVLSWVNVVFV